jgi:ABC-type multidrug transport system ATPase subunit
MGGPLTVIILLLIGSDPFDPKPNLIDISNIVSWILRFNPCFCLGRALYYALNIDFLTFIYPDLDTVWSEDVLLWDVVFLAWESVVYLLLAIQIDKWSTNPSIVSTWKSVINTLTCQFTKKMERDITTALEEDSDVLAEEERIASAGANNDLIVLDKLTKLYDNGKKAVNGLSLGIPPGQVFGLLGVNGAGKTTTMQMLTAEFPATTGDATLAGYSVSKQPEKTRRRVGYCPQFDAHFANMTGREHVELYATIKGIPMSLVKEAAAGKLAEVGLSPEDSDRLAANYSGGMKRRLSLATATIGDPQIVFLDECSTGVDPVARREIWELISNMVAGRNLAPEERTSVILTTHSMEECEALCPRIGIMANGRLRALGSAQHLKNKFGKGYQIEMKCKLVSKNDPDYKEVLAKLAQGVVELAPAIASEGETVAVPSDTDDVFFNLEQALAKLQDLTGDTYLSGVVHEKDPIGYNIYKSATSLTGVPLDELAAFATVELRVRKIAEFIVNSFSTNIFRERQDTKVRYEVNSEGIKISSIFASLEENKDRLLLDDYGVSQTSLEQVFNMHAALAEELKHGTNDG